MLRISDGRMSGTAGGTIVLHISPESAQDGSVFAVVRDGDFITCDVEQRLLRLDVSDEEIQTRIQERRTAIANKVEKGEIGNRQTVLSDRITRRGYRGLYERSVNQAHLGADFDFLTASGPTTA